MRYTIKRIEKDAKGKTVNETEYTGTMSEFVSKTFSDVLFRGYSWSREAGMRKINIAPTTIDDLLKALNDSEWNCRVIKQRVFYELVPDKIPDGVMLGTVRAGFVAAALLRLAHMMTVENNFADADPYILELQRVASEIYSEAEQIDIMRAKKVSSKTEV